MPAIRLRGLPPSYTPSHYTNPELMTMTIPIQRGSTDYTIVPEVVTKLKTDFWTPILHQQGSGLKAWLTERFICCDVIVLVLEFCRTCVRPACQWGLLSSTADGAEIASFFTNLLVLVIYYKRDSNFRGLWASQGTMQDVTYGWK